MKNCLNGVCFLKKKKKSMSSKPKAFTFITDTKADVRVALVRREEEIQEVRGADEELGNLSALVAPN